MKKRQRPAKSVPPIKPESRDPESSPSVRIRLLQAIALFATLMAAYLMNGDFLVPNDITPNLYLPINLLQNGRLTFTPEKYPFMFVWRLETEDGPRYGVIQRWDTESAGLYNSGKVKADKSKYYVVPSVYPNAYVNFFGIGAGLSALPIIAPYYAIKPKLADNMPRLWSLGKWIGAAFTAGSAVLIFLAACRYLKSLHAWLLALIYGLCTAVWTTCSQGLWQQSPNIFFLALGAFLLILSETRPRWAVGSGMAFAWAVLCRPTSALVVVCVAVYLLVVDRKRLIYFVLAGLPFAVGLALYNAHYLGSPLTFGQTEGGKSIALSKTGSPNVWQTPIHIGLTGLLFSPSRGLFIYSPFLLFALWGAYRIWTDSQWRALRPFCVATAAILLVECRHFDWWSGWSYGYRHILDITVFLALLLLPVANALVRRPKLLAVFGLLVIWSLIVQVVGAFAFELTGWNNRQATIIRPAPNAEPVTVLDAGDAAAMLRRPEAALVKKVNMDIDQPEHRHRLWSLTDTPILYYLTHFSEARQARRDNFARWLQSPTL